MLLAQDRVVDDQPCVARLHELHLVTALLRERVVREERHGLRLRGRAAVAAAAARREHNGHRAHENGECTLHGRTTSNVPSPNVTVAGASTTTLLTPRVVPSGRSSPCSGYRSPFVVML